jgi:hypothetical protein
MAGRIFARASDDSAGRNSDGVETIEHLDHARAAALLAVARRSVIVLLVAAGLAGCAYHNDLSYDAHFQRYKARLPEGDKVFVCSAYGCRTQTGFRFAQADIEQIQKLMSPAHTSSAADERQAVDVTLAWMERRVGDATGTSADRPADDMEGNGDPTQLDCVDVATNLTSYLLVLDRHNLLRHHSIGPVIVKEDLRRGVSGWPHYAAILVEKPSGQQFAVDGWLLARGVPPEIVEVEKWYVNDSDILVGSTSTVTAANTP